MVVYATSPVGAVVGRCTAVRVVHASAPELWATVGTRSAIEPGEFSRYLDGAASPGAIELECPKPIDPFRLAFRPPQAWMWLRPDDARHAEVLKRAGIGEACAPIGP
jgi:predicted transcriptional regulator